MKVRNCGQRADADLARDHLLAAEPQHQAHGDEEREVHGAGVADADVDALVGELERILLGAVELLQLMALRRKGAHDADAAEILVHHAAQHRQPLLQRQPGAAQRELGDRGAPGDERHEAQAEQPEHQIGAEQQIGADADQHAEQDDAHEAGRKEHAHAVEIEHAERDEVAGVDPVVEREAQPLDLLVERQAQFVAGLVADDLAIIVLGHREEAAQHADDQQDQRGRPQRMLRRRAGAAPASRPAPGRRRARAGAG